MGLDIFDSVAEEAEPPRGRRGSGEQPQRSKPPRRRGAKAATTVVLVVGGFAAGGFLLGGGIKAAVTFVQDHFLAPPDFEGPGTGSVQVTIEAGSSVAKIGNVLKDAGVIASVDAWTNLAALEPKAETIVPGVYQLQTQMSVSGALDAILDSDSRMVTKVTIKEGLWSSNVYDLLAKKLSLKAADLKAAGTSGKIGLPAYAKNNPEGYLFPATYEFEPGLDATQVLTRVVARYSEAAKSLDLETSAAALGRTPAEIMAVASIVEAESRRAEDFPKVARVVYNRLEQKMPLQMDSTVKYALKDTGVFTSDEDRQSSSPYNTYVHTGLPPTPINQPGERAIKAALQPAEGDWLYFVTVNLDSGEAKFTSSYAQHEKNVAELQQWMRNNQ